VITVFGFLVLTDAVASQSEEENVVVCFTITIADPFRQKENPIMAHVTFIHGISNKPPAEQLHRIWLNALIQENLGNDDALDLGAYGVTSSMVYWADVMFEKPLDDAALESVGDLENNAEVARQESDPDMSWRNRISGEEKRTVDALAARLSFDPLVDDDYQPEAAEVDRKLERIPIPWFIKRRLMKQFLRDVHHYLFNYEFSPRPEVKFPVQDEIRRRLVSALIDGSKKPGPHILLSHSMGTVIAYDCLKRIPECPSIDGLMTIGSPLGIDEIQDKFKPEWTRDEGFPNTVKGLWINIYDVLDPVTGFDGNIANDYKRENEEVIEVINEQNWGSWRHSITKYLNGPKLRAALAQQLGL
jgi:hypothetical protein